MRKLKVIIERAENNYSAYIESLDGITVSGKTILEINDKMREAIDVYVEACKDFGYEMSFEMDTHTLLVYYAGVFGKPALEKITGINAKQLWHYAMGKTKPGEAQKGKIRISKTLPDIPVKPEGVEGVRGEGFGEVAGTELKGQKLFAVAEVAGDDHIFILRGQINHR